MSTSEQTTRQIFAKRLKYYMELHHMNTVDISNRVGVSKQSVSCWCNGEKMPRIDKIEILCQIFGIKKSDLLEEKKKLQPPIATDDCTTLPVIGEIAAGYDSIAIEDWTGETIQIPNVFFNGKSASDYIVLSVKGNSMYPDYKSGDKVVVRKQPIPDYSGQIGAIIYDDDYATLKKIEYPPKKDWIRLVPLNITNYQPVTLSGIDLDRCTFIGVPKLVVREIED